MSASVQGSQKHCGFCFQNYDRVELDACGKAFVDLLMDPAIRQLLSSLQNVIEATELVFNWYFHACRGALVDARNPAGYQPHLTANYYQLLPFFCGPRTTKGEFIVDLCASNYPELPYDPKCDTMYYRTLLNNTSPQTLSLLLALECEWGKEGNPNATVAMVLYDALKLAHVRANAKVLIFGSSGVANCQEIIELATKLRIRTADPSPWLLVDWPWNWPGVADHDPHYLVLS